ncbi:hypothetical protein J6590_005328 [Homalodisca vitripennis]|nr:hypothetical protein J6590_005328 [Homalodisca vitripennis]
MYAVRFRSSPINYDLEGNNSRLFVKLPSNRKMESNNHGERFLCRQLHNGWEKFDWRKLSGHSRGREDIRTPPILLRRGVYVR